MIHQRPSAVSDQNRLKKLEGKEYRDAYLRSQTHSWIAYQFQALRAKFNLNQGDMAERTGKTQSTISRLECEDYGRVSVKSLLDVACAMDVGLIVKFVSYPEFLDGTRDKSELAMQPETIFESLSKAKSMIGAPALEVVTMNHVHPHPNFPKTAFGANEQNARQYAGSQPVPNYPSLAKRQSLSGFELFSGQSHPSVLSPRYCKLPKFARD